MTTPLLIKTAKIIRKRSQKFYLKDLSIEHFYNNFRASFSQLKQKI